MEIKNVRLTYIHVEEPHAAAQGAEPKYSVCMILPKNHEQIEHVRKAIKDAIAKMWGDKPPKGLRSPLRDGDAVDESGERLKGEEFAGSYFMTASNPRKVEAIIGKSQRKATGDDLVWGYYGSVICDFFPYDKAGNRGVGCGLNKLWITKTGDRLGGNRESFSDNAEVEDFDAIAERATSAGQQSGDIF